MPTAKERMDAINERCKNNVPVSKQERDRLQVTKSIEIWRKKLWKKLTKEEKKAQGSEKEFIKRRGF